MDESRPWLPAFSSEVLSLDPIRLVFSSVMSKKVPRGDKHRDEIVQMEEGSRTRSQRWDASALEGVPLVCTWSCLSGGSSDANKGNAEYYKERPPGKARQALANAVQESAG